MFGVPHHVQPPPAAAVQQADLDSSVTPASPARTYVVQAGDTLWSLAQRFYGNPWMWPHIYHANQPQIHDPNDIYVGERLTIPGAATASAATSTVTTPAPAQVSPAVPSSSLPGVPGVAAYYIRQAAKATGIHVRVVAAQNYVESSYGENIGPSSAGAEGPWQFEPYTWPSYSPAPFSLATNWSASTEAYINMMRQLLRWSGGDVRMALAAYNAGQGNWQAGLGYADEILSIAGRG
jgi:LysM repeat protein